MKSINSKSTVLAFGCMIALLGAATTNNVRASGLAPGGVLYPAPGEAEPVGGSTLDSTTSIWGGSFIKGSLTSSVISDDSSNPLGGLTFTYEFSADSDALHEISQLTVGGFTDFLADVSYDSGGGGVIPVFFTRSDEGGGFGTNIRFNFGPGVDPGQSSALLVVQTGASFWGEGTAAMINSESVSGIAILAPVVPEPATVFQFILAGGGLLGAWVFRNSRNNRTA